MHKISSVIKCDQQWHPSFTNQATNTSSIFVVVLQLLTMPVVIFLNAVTLIIIVKFEALQKERFVVLALLAVTDLLSGLISQPLFVAKELYHLLTNDVNCSLDSAFYLSSMIFSGASFYQLICLTYERYVAITDPFGYPNRITVRRLVFPTVANWFVHLAISVAFGITFSRGNYFLPIYVTISIILLFCILYWYIKIFAVIRKQNRPTQGHNASHGSSQSRNQPLNYKSTKTALLVTFAFSLSYLPLAFNIILAFKFGPRIRGPIYFAIRPWLSLFVHLNSLYSPIIYGLRTSEFRWYFLRLFGIQSNEAHPNAPAPFVVYKASIPWIKKEQPASSVSVAEEQSSQEQGQSTKCSHVGHPSSHLEEVLNVLPQRNDETIDSKENLDEQKEAESV